MKILFLDIDGVCNCASTKNKHGVFIGIDPILASRVKNIIEKTGCAVVLSSTWRLDEKSRQEVRDKVCEFISTTPRKASGFRGAEIDDWLSSHSELGITHHAILDDDNDFMPGQPLFQTSWQEGLTKEIMNDVINYLNDSIDRRLVAELTDAKGIGGDDERSK